MERDGFVTELRVVLGDGGSLLRMFRDSGFADVWSSTRGYKEGSVHQGSHMHASGELEDPKR